MRQRNQHVGEADDDFAANQRDKSGRAAFVGDVLQVNAGKAVEQFTRQMLCAAGSAGGEADLVRACLRKRDQFLY